MDKTFDFGEYLSERAECSNSYYLNVDNGINGIISLEYFPRAVFDLLITERDFLFVKIKILNVYVNGIADINDFRRMTDTLPGKLGSVNHAVNAAKSAGLSVSSIDYQYSDSTEGVVIAQSLSSGASVVKGTAITLTVSKGVAPVTVGNYVDMTISDATAQIEALGLNVSVVYQESDTDGIVLEQDVAADTSVAAGTTITLTVSQMAAAVEE